MNVNDAAEIKVDDALIAHEPFDQPVEFTIVSISILDSLPLPMPEADELDALMVEFAIVSSLICELLTPTIKWSPHPIPEPYELDALMVELAIVSVLMCELP
jgi:hypothetical protein